MKNNNKKAVVAGADTGVAGTEVVENIVTGSIQFMLPSPDESICMIHSSITNIQNTLTLHTGHLGTV